MKDMMNIISHTVHTPSYFILFKDPKTAHWYVSSASTPSPALLLSSTVRVHNEAYGVQRVVSYHIGHIVQNEGSTGCTEYSHCRTVHEQHHTVIISCISHLINLLSNPGPGRWHHRGLCFGGLAGKLGEVLIDKLGDTLPCTAMAILPQGMEKVYIIWHINYDGSLAIPASLYCTYLEVSDVFILYQSKSETHH